MTGPQWPSDPVDAEQAPGCGVQASGAIELYFYDEHTPGERIDVERHLRSCAECRLALEELRVIKAALASRPDTIAPAGGDWTAFMARLGDAVGQAGPIDAAPPNVLARPRVNRALTISLAAAAVLALAVAGAVTVQRHQPVARNTSAVASRVDPMPEASAPPARTDAPQPGFAAVSGQHFERSKLVILGLATKNARTASAADWAYERHLASSLLDDTRIYKQAAEGRGLESLAGVMSDLELVLLQTSLSDQRDTATLDRLQRLIRKRDLVTKLDVFEAANGF